MNSPRLNMELLLETPERIADGAGGFIETWAPLGTVWGEVTARTGRLVSGEAVAVSATGHRITLRAAPVGHSNRPRPGQRFRMGPRVFRVDAVSEADERGLYLTCQCEEELAV